MKPKLKSVLRPMSSTVALAITSFILVAGSFQAHAFPLPKNSQNAFDDFTISDLQDSVDEALNGAVDFTAILALNNCSASLVRFETSLPNDRAMALTNGHCYEGGFTPYGEIVTQQSSARRMTVLSPTAKKLGIVTADQVIYSTMTDTDVTLYRLKETFADIERDFNTQALTISSKHPTAGTEIAIASGYWKKIYQCKIDRFIYQLKEGDWTMKDSIRYTQPGCEIIHGTSGSPIIDVATKEIVGINNTTNDDGEKCTENNPCEVDENGNIVFEKGASYGQQTYKITTCLNEKNELDLKKEGCLLFKP